MIVATAAHAHEIVAHWRGARPGRSPGIWRWLAEERRGMAAHDEIRGRTESARVEREIAEIFDAAAVERQAEIDAQVAEYERAEHEREAASEARIAKLRAERGLK